MTQRLANLRERHLLKQEEDRNGTDREADGDLNDPAYD
jgi:hypothetical protein